MHIQATYGKLTAHCREDVIAGPQLDQVASLRQRSQQIFEFAAAIAAFDPQLTDKLFERSAPMRQAGEMAEEILFGEPAGRTCHAYIIGHKSPDTIEGMQMHAVRLDIPSGANIIVGTSHFIKTVEDLYEALVNTVPQMKFGIAFNEASGACLVRTDGNDQDLVAS